MSSLRADLTALLDRQREEGLKVVTLDALELVLNPRHQVTIDLTGNPAVTHPRACRDQPQCHLATVLATAHLISSPHARGHTFEVWLEPGSSALSFLDITGREGA